MSHEAPQGGIDYPRTHAELLSWFPDDPPCLDYLEWLRWPEGFVCPALRHAAGLADGGWALVVRRLRAARVGYRGHHLPRHPDAADHLVPRRVAAGHPEERRERYTAQGMDHLMGSALPSQGR